LLFKKFINIFNIKATNIFSNETIETVILKVFDGIGDVFLLKLRPQAQLSDLLHLLSVYQTSSTANRIPHCIFFFYNKRVNMIF